MTAQRKTNAKSPEPVDIAVGERIRLQRRLRGMSQETLARAIGISFQQLQKYERGKNRIGASRLQQISEFLAIPVSYLFSGKPFQARPKNGGTEFPEREELSRFLATEEGQTLNLAFKGIDSLVLKRRVVHLVKAIATSGAQDRKGN